MSNISNELINEIRTKTDIVEVISKYVSLNKRGKNYFGVCPFHDDHSPSMSVSPEKQIYTCFSCGASGNVFTFVSDYEHVSFIEAVKLLGTKLGYNLENIGIKENKDNTDLEIYSLATRFYQNNIYTSLGKNAINYLENRHIDLETIKRFGIGLSIPKISLTDYLINKKYPLNKLIDLGITNQGSNDLFINRIMFPLYDLSGNVVGFSGRIYNTKDSSKYINTKETNIFKKGNLLYNYHLAREHLKKNDSVIIMEGFMDVIRASTVDINNCVATMGTALTKNHVALLKKMTNNIILCFDGDEAGEEATIGAIKLLESEDINIKIIRLEDDLDPDEYIIKNGVAAFLNKIDKAMNLIEYKMNALKGNKNLSDVKDISDYIEETIKELVNVNDDILVELSLKKLANEYNVDYLNLENKYLSLKNKNKKEEQVIIKPKKIYSRYGQAERNLIYYMLKDNSLIKKVEKQVIMFPDTNLRYLVNEIIYYYHKYDKIEFADFITYISTKTELAKEFNDIINMDIKDEYTEEEIEDYIHVVNEYPKKKKIENLELKLKQESDPLKQASIVKEIMDVKGVEL